MLRSEVVDIISGMNSHERVVALYNSLDPLPRGYKLQSKDPWCAATVTAVFLKAGVTSFAECSCSVMKKKLKDLGFFRYKEYDPKPGDIIFYDWDKDDVPDHVGIIINKSGDSLLVREGNKNNRIGERVIKTYYEKISGYGVPDYEEDLMKTIKKNDIGKAVAIWQLIVDAYPDGEFKDETEKATKIFQENEGLEADGVVGPLSWYAGLKSVNK